MPLKPRTRCRCHGHRRERETQHRGGHWGMWRTETTQILCFQREKSPVEVSAGWFRSRSRLFRYATLGVDMSEEAAERRLHLARQVHPVLSSGPLKSLLVPRISHRHGVQGDRAAGVVPTIKWIAVASLFVNAAFLPTPALDLAFGEMKARKPWTLQPARNGT